MIAPSTAFAAILIERSGEVEVDVDFLCDFQNEDAWVFQAPLHVGNDEAAFGGDAAAFDVDLHGDGDVVCGAVEREDAGDLNG